MAAIENMNKVCGAYDGDDDDDRGGDDRNDDRGDRNGSRVYMDIRHAVTELTIKAARAELITDLAELRSEYADWLTALGDSSPAGIYFRLIEQTESSRDLADILTAHGIPATAKMMTSPSVVVALLYKYTPALAKQVDDLCTKHRQLWTHAPTPEIPKCCARTRADIIESMRGLVGVMQKVSVYAMEVEQLHAAVIAMFARTAKIDYVVTD